MAGKISVVLQGLLGCLALVAVGVVLVLCLNSLSMPKAAEQIKKGNNSTAAANNNIRAIELTNDDGNITEFWEYNTSSKSLDLVKSVIDGKIDTSKTTLKLIRGDFTNKTIVEGKGGVNFTLEPDSDNTGAYVFVVDSPIGKIKGNGTFIIKSTISTSNYDEIVGDWYYSEQDGNTELINKFGYKIQKVNETELKFIPYNYTEGNQIKRDEVVSIYGDRYILTNKDNGRVLDITYSNGVFSGTENYGNGAYSVTLSKIGARNTPANIPVQKTAQNENSSDTSLQFGSGKVSVDFSFIDYTYGTPDGKVDSYKFDIEFRSGKITTVKRTTPAFKGMTVKGINFPSRPASSTTFKLDKDMTCEIRNSSAAITFYDGKIGARVLDSIQITGNGDVLWYDDINHKTRTATITSGKVPIK